MKNSTSNALATGAIMLLISGGGAMLTAKPVSKLYTQETVLDIKVTEEQKSRYEAIRWLISDDNRQEGRTYLMALAFIDKAMKNKGRPVRIFDHNTDVNNAHIFSVIGNIMNSHGDQGIGIKFEFDKSTITAYDITVPE